MHKIELGQSLRQTNLMTKTEFKIAQLHYTEIKNAGWR